MIDPVLAVSLRCLLAAVFASAAWHKASNPSTFRATLRAYRVLPTRISGFTASLLPGLELAVAVGLLLPTHRWAAYAALGMLSAYTAAIGINLLRGRRDIDCGCFGPAHRVRLSELLLLRNALLMGAAAVVLAPLAPRPLVWVDILTALSVVTVTGLLWVSFWRLRSLTAARGGSR